MVLNDKDIIVLSCEHSFCRLVKISFYFWSGLNTKPIALNKSEKEKSSCFLGNINIYKFSYFFIKKFINQLIVNYN